MPLLVPTVAELRGVNKGRGDDGRVENAAASWTAHAATTRLTKKDFMVASKGMKR